MVYLWRVVDGEGQVLDALVQSKRNKRRMMFVSVQDRISGHANRVRVLDRLLVYATSKPGVWFARKDEISKWALEHRSITPIYDRGAPTVSGGLISVEATVQSSTRIPPRNANTDIESSLRRESPAEPRGCIAEQSVQLVV
jgi:hypothetical protein